jgi:hypothetical protein
MFPTPLTSVTDFTYSACSPELWPVWANKFVRLPNIRDISLSLNDVFFVVCDDERPIVLPSLVSLELRQLSNVEDVRKFLALVSLQNI